MTKINLKFSEIFAPVGAAEASLMDAFHYVFIRRALWLSLGLDAVLALHNLWLRGPLLIPLLNLAVISAILAALRHRRQGYRVLLGPLLAFWILSVAHDAWFWPLSGTPPSLIYLSIMGLVATLFCGPRIGMLCFLACFALLLALTLHRQVASGQEFTYYLNLLSACLGTQAFVTVYWMVFRSFIARLNSQKVITQEGMRQQERLTRALMVDLNEPLRTMAKLLQEEEPELEALVDQNRKLTRTLKEARPSVRSFQEEVPPPLPDIVASIRLRATHWQLYVLAVFTASLVLRIVMTGIGPLYVLPAYLVFAVLMVALRLRPDWVAGVNWAMAALVQGLALWSLGYWKTSEAPPPLAFEPTLTGLAVLMGGIPGFLGIGASCLGALGFAALRGWAANPGVEAVLASLAAAVVASGFSWYLLSRLLRTLLETLESEERALRHQALMRARLGGTLFHDVANPVSAISTTLELVKAGGLDDELRDLLRRFCSRLSALITAAAAVMHNEGPLPPESIRSVEILGLARDLNELFADRLSQKGQRLDFGVSSGLSVLAEPELLRDSVLANLLSNAIKFSPMGAVIEFGAKRSHGEVEMFVRDKGPGLPEGLSERLEGGSAIPSTRGSADEEGLGLGLRLAREYASRMGGSLSFHSPPGSGCEAAVRLPWAKN